MLDAWWKRMLAAVDSLSMRRRWSTDSPLNNLCGGARFAGSRHVAYLVIDEVIVVLAIAHDHRRPNYWRGRAPA